LNCSEIFLRLAGLFSEPFLRDLDLIWRLVKVQLHFIVIQFKMKLHIAKNRNKKAPKTGIKIA